MDYSFLEVVHYKDLDTLELFSESPQDLHLFVDFIDSDVFHVP
jgi:hypothetical protein